MSGERLHIGPWEALEGALLEGIREEHREGGLFTEHWVVVPHVGLVRHLQHLLASGLGAVAGLRVIRLEEAAERIRSGEGGGSSRRLDLLGRDLLLRGVLRERMGRLRGLLGTDLEVTPSLLEAAAKSVYDLREAGVDPDEVRGLARGGGGRSSDRLRAVAELLEGYLSGLEARDAVDDESLLREAAEVRGGPVPPQRIRVYGFYDVTGGQQALLDAWITGGLGGLYLPWYPESEAYAGALRAHWEEMAGEPRVYPGDEAAREFLSFDELAGRIGGDSGPTLTLISAPGRGREVDTALRLLAGAWEAGVPGHPRADAHSTASCGVLRHTAGQQLTDCAPEQGLTEPAEPERR
ncbi:MAG: hypothetical protein R6W82_10855, partial [bacterium]